MFFYWGKSDFTEEEGILIIGRELVLAGGETMLLARNEQRDLVTFAGSTLQEINKFRSQKYYCPDCQEEVILKAGTRVTAHFAHKNQGSCMNKGEGRYHEEGKWALYNWFIQQNVSAQLEVTISSIQQRADILLQLGEKKVAIEFQCATLPEKDVINRTMGYCNESIIPIWILGGNRMKRIGSQSLRLSSSEKVFLRVCQIKCVSPED
ncbi:hypothetical protein KO561_06430 [Radiobacillus kanasensis]|uniref:competence protein CoiA n=1 Tax=Radiobacillus kanasensis TaxID=2844358 RepID=UPI001E5F22D3|nr:competence protein CoiA family protein [Radiobacillus kanasensis]UFU00573.1 hypothetical protein KO561_06430 [Radiobacillus kanasensis]